MKFYVTYAKCKNQNGDCIHKEFRFFNIDNAYRNAMLLSGCEDVIGDVDTIDTETGEVLFVYHDGHLTYRSFVVQLSCE